MFTFFTISVNCGEGEVAQLIQKERESLRPDQFFDVDMVMVPYIIMIMFIVVADDHDRGPVLGVVKVPDELPLKLLLVPALQVALHLDHEGLLRT